MKKARSDRAIAEDIARSLESHEEETARDPGADVRALLQRAKDAGGGDLRAHYLIQAQRALARLNPMRHQAVIQGLQGHILALQGRGGDTKVAHVTPGEVIIPKRLQTPELMAALAAAARANGMDPAKLLVGSGRNSINPNTGQPEFDSSILAPPQGDMETVTVTGKRLPQLTPEDQKLLTRMIFTEAAEDYRQPGLYQALGSTALNRQGLPQYGNSVDHILRQPQQFQGIGRISPDPNKPSQWQRSENPDILTGANKKAFETARTAVNGLADGSLSDNTGGATRFGSRLDNGELPTPMATDMNSGAAERTRDDLGQWTFLRDIRRKSK